MVDHPHLVLDWVLNRMLLLLCFVLFCVLLQALLLGVSSRCRVHRLSWSSVRAEQSGSRLPSSVAE